MADKKIKPTNPDTNQAAESENTKAADPKTAAATVNLRKSARKTSRRNFR